MNYRNAFIAVALAMTSAALAQQDNSKDHDSRDRDSRQNRINTRSNWTWHRGDRSPSSTSRPGSGTGNSSTRPYGGSDTGHSWNRPSGGSDNAHGWNRGDSGSSSDRPNNSAGGNGWNRSENRDSGRTWTHQSPRPTYGRGWNFGRDRSLIGRNYEHDSASSNLRVNLNVNVYQRPTWGGHWREGYLGWGGDAVGFHSSSFRFGLYLYTPFAEPCVVSPWYYYSSLPPYIPAERTYVVRDYNCMWDAGVVYMPDDGDGRIDDAIYDLKSAFADQNPAAVDALMPEFGRVAIFTDGAYDYSLDSSDFHDMFADNVRNTNTERFEIESVRRTPSGAIIRARHEVQNPDGGVETVEQRYRLRNEDGRLVITDFMTSH